jgi:DNA invertase Pin-like site-specific DNA recombinase
VGFAFSKTILEIKFSFPMLLMSIENITTRPELPIMLIGYARVSTEDQNLELQLAALKRASCKRIFTDKVSGAKADRPGLRETLSHLRETDTLVVWKLDRLGRSVKGLVDLVNELQERHVHFKSVTDGIDTKTPAGRFFFHVMASLAQMERELIIERTRAGLEAAKRQGRVGGRKRRMTEGKVKAARKLLSSGTPPRDVAQSLGVSVPTLYRWVPASTRM